MDKIKGLSVLLCSFTTKAVKLWIKMSLPNTVDLTYYLY